MAPSLLDHPAAPGLGAAAVLGLQRTHGNGHVARLLVRRFPLLVGVESDQATAEIPFVGTDEEKTRFDAIKTIMEASPTGQEALAILGKYAVQVYFVATGGSSFSPSTNKIKLNSTHSDERAALTMVHEANHARYKHEGLSADIMALSREDYVKQKVQEEAEGAVKSIEAKVELEGTTIDVSKATFPQEQEYREAYQKAIDAAKASDPAATEDDLKKRGREAGKARVIQGFMDGEVVTSTDGKSYPDYYGDAWDKKHP